MGYYKETDNVYADEYNVIRDNNEIISYSAGIRIITKPTIVLINNESLKFNFEKYILTYYTKALADENINIISNEIKNKAISVENAEKISPYDKIKIKIDFGDGNKEVLSKPLTHKEYILYGNDTWYSTTHFYSFNDKKYFENINYITAEIRNIEGIVDKVVIPFIVLNSSAADYNVKLDLISANLTNSNDISFVFNILNDNQIVFATNKENS
jgi:hypothetical protein